MALMGTLAVGVWNSVATCARLGGMSRIVLSTLNAKFIHASVGLRYLYANLDELQPQGRILEFEASQPAREVVESILEADPSIVGFGVYIWNVSKTREVISLLKKVRPEIVVVIGGRR